MQQKLLRDGLCILSVAFLMSSCKKLVKVGEPVNSITTNSAFSTDANATAAVMRIYNDMVAGNDGGSNGYANCLTTFLAGLSADELIYNSTGELSQFQSNSVQSVNNYLNRPLWVQAYHDIYLANAAIEGVQASSTLSEAVKRRLLGESMFVRAFVYFYLINFFNDVPLMKSTSWSAASSMSRTEVTEIYQMIVDDLKYAQNLLPDNYDVSQGKRIRVNKMAAEAMLARVYLYTREWGKAEEFSSAVINNSSFILEPDPELVFDKNSHEAIWQLEINDTKFPYATREGNIFIPENSTKDYTQDIIDAYAEFFIPTYYFTNQLATAFEPNDLRMAKWVDSTGPVLGTNYFYPFKYRKRQGSSGNVSEYYVMLRLAEQYLIRAEARAKQNKLSEAISDLNAIRTRAGLPNLESSLTSDQVMAGIAQERRVELFAEWGHRWLDLKRNSQADAVLSGVKGANWQTTDQLWPIPQSEIQVNSNLRQNPGYN